MSARTVKGQAHDAAEDRKDAKLVATAAKAAWLSRFFFHNCIGSVRPMILAGRPFSVS